LAKENKRGDHLEKKNDYSSKSFHKFCFVLLIAMFATLMVVMILQDDVDEPTLLHTAVCAMIMLMNIILAVCYSSGHYLTTQYQDQIYMMLLILVSLSLLILGVYRLVIFNSTCYNLEPYILQGSLILTAAWTWLSGFFYLTFFALPKKRKERIRNVIIVISVLFIALVITNPLTGLLIGEAGSKGTSPGPFFSLSWVYFLGLSAWYSVMILKFVENRRDRKSVV